MLFNVNPGTKVPNFLSKPRTSAWLVFKDRVIIIIIIIIIIITIVLQFFILIKFYVHIWYLPAQATCFCMLYCTLSLCSLLFLLYVSVLTL
jgi:hypothetical protein